MGSDLLRSLHLWDDGQRMIDTIPIVLQHRPGYLSEEGSDHIRGHPNFPKNDPILVTEEMTDGMATVSSTEVRRRFS